MTFSKIFFYFCLAFIVGIFLNSLYSIPQSIELGFLFSGIFLLIIALIGRNKKLTVLGFCLFFVFIGSWRYQIAESKILNNELKEYNDWDQKIILSGVVIQEPEIKIDRIRLEVKVEELTIDNERVIVSGKALVTADLYPKYDYGDKIKIKGKLNSPPVFEGFNYKDYLARKGVYSVLYWPEIELIAQKKGNPVSTLVLSFKEKLRTSVNQNLAPPQSVILEGIILGEEGRMAESLKEKFNITGLRHITAVSGMHITILSAVLMQLLIGFGFWRKQAFYLTIILLFLFIVMVGLPSSAVRAGIMGGFFLFSQKIGRKNSAGRTIIFAAAIILIFNPLLLRFDVGFQLSFLAVAGIIYLNPIFLNWFKIIPEKEFLNLRSIISMTLAAQIFTLPILVYNFGRISLVGLLANILILPFISLLTGMGFLFGLMGIIFQPLARILSWFCWLFLTYILKVTDFLSSLSFSSITLENIHWFWLVIFYFILGFLIRRFREKNKLKFLNY